MVVVASLSASATYAGHDTTDALSRANRAKQAHSAVRTPTLAVHPSRSKRATVKGAPRTQKLDVMTKLAMWGVDVGRMREGVVSRRFDDTEPFTSSSTLVDRRGDAADATATTEEVGISGDFAAAAQPETSTSTSDEDDADDSSAAARLASLIARQRRENWPTVGTEAWAYARTRIVSASEAAAALGLDRFRSPEKLIADKLARLDAAQGVDAETLTAIAALNPGYESGAGESSLGWRAAKGGKGKKLKKKRKAQRGGVGGQRAASPKPSVKYLPPAVVHGNDFEPVARAHYQNMEGVEVYEFGLKIHDQLSWLGATPDGVAVVGGTTTPPAPTKKKLVVLEIKCPYTRPVLPVSRAKEHFPQIQVALHVFGADECHFVQYKPPGIGQGRAGVMNEDRPLYLREVIQKDDRWWQIHKPKLERFHLKLENAITERERRLAATGWRSVNDGGEVDWEDDVIGANF